MEHVPAEVRVLLLHGNVWVTEPLSEVGSAPAGTYLAPEDLHLSPGLGEDLQSWHADADNPLWRAIADDRDPSRIGSLPDDYRPDPQHAVHGFRLAARLQRELGEHWRVLHSSSHSFAGDESASTTHTILLRALDGDPIAGLVEVIDDHHRQQPARAVGATPQTVEKLARWRRGFLVDKSAESRADGADVAADLQHDLGLTAQIHYWAGDASPAI